MWQSLTHSGAVFCLGSNQKSSEKSYGNFLEIDGFQSILGPVSDVSNRGKTADELKALKLEGVNLSNSTP